MSRRLPPLGSVRAFEAAARHLSFTRAAFELGITQAAVSWQIRTLEERLGLPLFERRRSGLVLTQTGRAMAPDLTQALEALAAVFEKAMPLPATGGTLRISASPTFAHAWLASRLGAFRALHPGIMLHVDGTRELADIGDGSADLAIRRGRGEWPEAASHKLMPVVLAPFCAPAMLQQLAAAPDADDLLRLPLLQPAAMWQRWLADAGTPTARIHAAAQASYGGQHMVIQAAIAGQGVGLVHPLFCADAIAGGQLVPAHPHVLVSPDDGYWLVHSSRRRLSKAGAAFRDWIVAAAADRPAIPHDVAQDNG